MLGGRGAVREVMSSPVVCVPPEMPLKEVAELLVRDGISAVPVVEGGELVGIISEADLVPLELAPDPRAHLIAPAELPGHLPKVAAEAMTREVVAPALAAATKRPAADGTSDPRDGPGAGLRCQGNDKGGTNEGLRPAPARAVHRPAGGEPGRGGRPHELASGRRPPDPRRPASGWHHHRTGCHRRDG